MAAVGRHPINDKRDRLIDAAAELAYEQGFGATTIADVAERAGVPLGNVYYYFRSRDALGEALIARQRDSHRLMRRQWEDEPDPRRRLAAFVDMASGARRDLARYGCPMGSLCTELGKAGGPLAAQAGRLIADWLAWAESQFRALGHGDESPALAVHLMAALQGAAVVAQAARRPNHVETEARRLHEWIVSLPGDGTEQPRRTRGTLEANPTARGRRGAHRAQAHHDRR